MKSSVLCRALLLAACAATPAACAVSPATELARAADPVIETRTTERLICPDELRQALPARVDAPADLVIEVPENVMDWIRAHLLREMGLEQRLTDARKQCPA